MNIRVLEITCPACRKEHLISIRPYAPDVLKAWCSRSGKAYNVDTMAALRAAAGGVNGQEAAP